MKMIIWGKNVSIIQKSFDSLKFIIIIYGLQVKIKYIFLKYKNIQN